MATANEEILRSRYQQAASLFLLSTLSNHDSSYQGKQKKKKNEFDPLETAKSLMLRSIYDVSHSFKESDFSTQEARNNARCILPNDGGTKLKEAQLYHFKSGARTTSIPADNLQHERTKLDEEQIRELNIMGGKSTTSIAEKSKLFSKLIGSGDHGTSKIFNGLSSDFYCSSCGLPYFTPFLQEGTGVLDAKVRLKPIKPSRTKRRRASRYMAAKNTFENEILQKHKGGGKKFGTTVATGSSNISHGSAVATIMETNTALKQGHEVRRINDGIAKHFVVYKCSYCEHEQVFKGLRRDTNQTTSQRMTSQISSQVKDTTSRKRPLMKSQNNSNKNNQKLEAEEEDDNFMAFEPIVKPKSGTQNNLPLLQSKKKKSKKPKKGKSALMDFLSSLND